METSTARATQAPAASFYMNALEKLQETGHSVPRRRRARVLALHEHSARYEGHGHLRQDRPIVRVCSRRSPRRGIRRQSRSRIGWGRSGMDDYFVDVIFSSGNGVARVDDLWFEHAPKANMLGLITRLTPAEELIWSKAFVQERERFDGADIIHLLRETGPSLDWPRLLMRFADYWRVLFSHLILFGFVYPDKRESIPAWVMDELVRRLGASRTHSDNDVCYGTLLSREQYLYDLERLRISRQPPRAARVDDPRAARSLDCRHRLQGRLMRLLTYAAALRQLAATSMRCCISAGDTSSTWVAIDHMCPNGSVNVPERSP